MTYSEFRYLWQVGRLASGGAVRLRDVTNAMTVSKVSVFRAVERLEHAGYVDKSRDRKIRLTEKGQKILEEYRCAMRCLQERLLAPLGFAEDRAEEEAMRLVSALSEKGRKQIASAWQGVDER